MGSIEEKTSWRTRVNARLRQALDELARSMPVSAALVRVRRDFEGPFETSAFSRLDDGLDEAALSEVLSEAALAWLEVNRRELILEMRPQYSQGELYRPLMARGIVAAMIAPLLYLESLQGAVIVAGRRHACYTPRDVTLFRLAAQRVASIIPSPGSGAWEDQAEVETRREAPLAEPAEETSEAAATVNEPEHSMKADHLLERAPTEPVDVQSEPADAPTEENVIHLETDSLGRIDVLRGDVADVLGWSRDEVLGSCLTLFWDDRYRNLLDPALRNGLLRDGSFRSRALCYTSDGRPVTCEIRLTEIRSPGGRLTGHRAVIRPVKSQSLLPREDLEFGFARLYAFMNPLKPHE